MKKAQAWPAGKLQVIKGSTQDRLAALYSPAIAAEVRRERSRRGVNFAEGPELDKALAEIKQRALADGKTLTDAEARAKAIEQGRFDHLYPAGDLAILQQRGLAGEPVVFDRANTGSWSPDPNKAVNEMVPNKPGVYVFAVTFAGLTDTSKDIHTVTVERRSDGSTSVLSGGPFQTAHPDVKTALNVPVLDSNPNRHGSRAVVVYPLNPTPVKK